MLCDSVHSLFIHAEANRSLQDFLMNIVLIGYRGTGKTTVGHILAKRLGMRYVGLDAEIVRRTGKSIPEIVGEQGWEGFRNLESEVVRETSGMDGCILDTGGGVILRDENVTRLRSNGIIFWLQASVDDILNRIRNDTQRPSLTGNRTFTEEVKDVLAERLPKYAAAADYSVNTSNVSAQEAAALIIQLFRERAGCDSSTAG